jgi:D-tyrosyl-tRNA(Tyr) deacylase
VKAVLQRVKRASVSVDGQVIGTIGSGLFILLGVGQEDADSDADTLAARIPVLRIFPNEAGKLDRSLLDVKGGALVVSQFTLFADTSRGRRPSFSGAALPDKAVPLYERVVAKLREAGVETATGRFGADMSIELVADGPVTLVLESAGLRGGA